MSQQRYKPAVCSQPDLSARARRCTWLHEQPV